MVERDSGLHVAYQQADVLDPGPCPAWLRAWRQAASHCSWGLPSGPRVARLIHWSPPEAMPDKIIYVDRFMLTDPLPRESGGWWYQASVPKAPDGPDYRAVLLANPLAAKDLPRAIALAERLLECRHPRVQSIHAAGHKVPTIGPTEGFLYAVIDPIDEHRNLEEMVLSRGPIRERAAVQIGIDMVEAVIGLSIYEAPHGWIQPDRVFIAEKGRAVLMNPWIGWLQELNRVGSTTGSSDWKFTWIAPEVITNPGSVSLATDLFSICAIIYATLSGRPPFESTSQLALDDSVFKIEAPDVREFCPTATPQIAEILSNGLAMDPNQRYQNALDLLADLNAIADGSPGSGTSVFVAGGGISDVQPKHGRQRSGDISDMLSARRSGSASGRRTGTNRQGRSRSPGRSGVRSRRAVPITAVVLVLFLVLVAIIVIVVVSMSRPPVSASGASLSLFDPPSYHTAWLGEHIGDSGPCRHRHS